MNDQIEARSDETSKRVKSKLAIAMVAFSLLFFSGCETDLHGVDGVSMSDQLIEITNAIGDLETCLEDTEQRDAYDEAMRQIGQENIDVGDPIENWQIYLQKLQRKFNENPTCGYDQPRVVQE